MTTPLPSPSSLRAALVALERAVSGFEATQAGTTFTATSSDGKVQVKVSGIGRVKSVSIDPSLVTPTTIVPTLQTKVLTTINAAIDAAYAGTRALAASFASALALPGLPAASALPPDYLDFVPTVDSITAQILANNPCNRTTLYQCTSGPVTAVVDAHRRVITLTFATPLTSNADYLGVRTLQAVNCAVDKSTDPTDTVTPGLVNAPGLNDLVIYAKGTLKLNDRVKVRSLNCSNWGWIANAAATSTALGNTCETGNVSSRAKIVLNDHGKIHGFAATEDVLEQHADPTVDGAILEHLTLVLPDLALNVPFPGVTIGTIDLEPGQTQTAPPGYYANLHPKNGAIATLSSGVYYFNTLFLEPGSTVKLNQSSGPVVIWVKSSFTHRGTFVDVANGFPRLFIGYVGTSTAIVETKFRGTLSAPNTKISISTIQSHEGAFHGRDVEVQPDCQICHRPFELHYDQLPGIVPPGGFPPPVVDLGFETVAGWSTPGAALLTQVTTPVTQGAKALQISNLPGSVDIVTASFSANLAPQGTTRLLVDLFVPFNQPSGSLVATISAPSAGVNNVNLGSVSTTGRPQNAYSQFEFALPTAVRTALDGTASDVSLKLTLNVAANSGPWTLDNVRFLLAPPALSTLDPILSFEDTTKWTCAEVALTSSTTVKSNLTKSLQITTAPANPCHLVSAVFASGALSAPLGKFRIDLWKPSTQPNPNFHGQFQLFIDIPSAGITNASTSVVDLKPLAGNAFSTIELALPADVVLAINGEYSDVKLRPVLTLVQGTGPWRLDFIRFV
jgi:DNA-binding protein YbaB